MLRTFIFNFILGTAFAIIIQYGWSHGNGGDWTRLLAVGEESPLRPLIEAEIKPLSLVAGHGHDGRWNYLVARQPLSPSSRLCGTGNTECDIPYRYRRILLPLLAGLGGLLPPMATLCGMILVSAIGFGLASGSLACCLQLNRSSILKSLAVFANPGLLVSLVILSSDSLAAGFAVLGILLWKLRRTVPCAIALGLAALSKETWLLVPASLCLIEILRKDYKNAIIISLAALPVCLWTIILQFLASNAETNYGLRNFSFPFLGILDASEFWASIPVNQIAMLYIVALGLVFLICSAILSRNLNFIIMSLPWVMLAIVMSEHVWIQGGDAARALAAIWILIVIRPIFVNYESSNARFALVSSNRKKILSWPNFIGRLKTMNLKSGAKDISASKSVLNSRGER